MSVKLYNYKQKPNYNLYRLYFDLNTKPKPINNFIFCIEKIQKVTIKSH